MKCPLFSSYMHECPLLLGRQPGSHQVHHQLYFLMTSRRGVSRPHQFSTGIHNVMVGTTTSPGKSIITPTEIDVLLCCTEIEFSQFDQGCPSRHVYTVTPGREHSLPPSQSTPGSQVSTISTTRFTFRMVQLQHSNSLGNGSNSQSKIPP